MLQIKDIFQLEPLQNIQFYAGHRGQNRVISTVTIMDIPEIAEWLSGGELVIAGVLFQQCFSRSLIDSFLQKNIAGIVTKQKFLSEIPAGLIDYCNETGFPVLLAPETYNWGQVMNPIVTDMIRKPYLVIEENQNFHYSLMKSMIAGSSLSEMCNQLYQSNQLILAVADTDLHLEGYSDCFDWKEYTRKLVPEQLQYSGTSMDNLDHETVSIYTYMTPLLASQGVRIFLFPILLHETAYGYILLCTSAGTDKLDETIVMKIQQFSLVVALQFGKQNDINTATRHFNSFLFEKLLQAENLTHEDAVHYLAPLEKKIHRRYYVLYFQSDSSSNIDSFIQQSNRISRFHTMVRSTLPNAKHILMFEKENAQVVLLPYPYTLSDEAHGYADLETDVLKLRELYIRTLKPESIFIGISQPAELSYLSEAFRQAKLAASFLSGSRKTLPYMLYQDLGMIRYFFNHSGELDYKFLEEFIQKYVTPLEDYDRKHHTELLRTLKLFLANNGSKTETEHELFIHKNTLRARLSTINKVLGCNVDLLEDLFEIQLAFRLKHLFEKDGNFIP